LFRSHWPLLVAGPVAGMAGSWPLASVPKDGFPGWITPLGHQGEAPGRLDQADLP
jgi:hypothetical protein